MNAFYRKASVLALSLSIAPAVALAASPKPAPLPTPNLPNKPLHVQFIVEVNNLGQVVRVDHGTLSGNKPFDTMTLGNAMQMWIRRPNGSSEAGLYRVNYDYNPRNHEVSRVPSIIRPGGSWATKPGAATMIIEDARRQVREAQARLRAEQAKQRAQSEQHLPDINAAVKRAVLPASPSPSPHP
jgi:hypothetical protein